MDTQTTHEFETWWKNKQEAEWTALYGPDEKMPLGWGLAHKKHAREGYMTALAASQTCVAKPELPVERFCAWMQNGRTVNAFPHGVGDPAKWDYDGMFASKGYSRAPLYTLDQMREYGEACVRAALSASISEKK